MEASERTELIRRYEAGAGAVIDALAGMTEEDLDSRPTADGWTPREVVHHLADAEMRSAIRLRQLIAEDDPVIQGYDEKTYTRALHYDRPIDASLAAFVASRRTSAELSHDSHRARGRAAERTPKAGPIRSKTGSSSTRRIHTITPSRSAAHVPRPDRSGDGDGGRVVDFRSRLTGGRR